AFSGLLAYAIGFMNGDSGLEGRSWIFVLKGVATIVAGLLAFFGECAICFIFLSVIDSHALRSWSIIRPLQSS
ncbi:hypothetical protein PAXINDRAFT_91147, partial [Paxillus involutus ATCC 200175]